MCVRVWCVVWFQGMVAVMRVVWADGQWWRASAGASDADASAAGASAAGPSDAGVSDAGKAVD